MLVDTKSNVEWEQSRAEQKLKLKKWDGQKVGTSTEKRREESQREQKRRNSLLFPILS